VSALVRGQFWLIPAAMGAGGLVLALWVLSSGAALQKPFGENAWWLYSGDAATARDLLSTLLSGVITMASLMVSLTFVVLSLAANQLGPRLVTIITGDRQIQGALGFLLGTVAYVLVILRSLDETLGREGVPHLAITVASGLTLLCLLALLLYMHKISRSIISDVVVRRVAHELRQSIETAPEPSQRDASVPQDFHRVGGLALGRAGYVETIDYDRLVAAAEAAGAVLRLHVRAGHFVLRDGEHAEILARGPLPSSIDEAVRDAIAVGPERSPAQDLEYAIRQLVETALRALSAGIKDPFTVVAVIDQLGASLEVLFRRGEPPAFFTDRAGALRVIANHSSLDGLLDAAFDQIRQGGADDPAILIHLADTFGKLGRSTAAGGIRRHLLVHLDRVAETARNSPIIRCDLDRVLQRTEDARSHVSAAQPTKPAPAGPFGHQ
jgi:uncharacterized membrane protein